MKFNEHVYLIPGIEWSYTLEGSLVDSNDTEMREQSNLDDELQNAP